MTTHKRKPTAMHDWLGTTKIDPDELGGTNAMTGIVENGQLKATYTFDATNMMVGAFSQDRGKAEYSYNGFRNRIKKLENFSNPQTAAGTNNPDPLNEVRYVLDMTLPYNNLLMTNGTQEQSFVWGNELLSGIEIDKAVIQGEGIKFNYLQDHLGSPVRLFDEAGACDVLAWDEWGVPSAPVAESGNRFANPFGFTGYQVDSISDLTYAQARYYDPLIRFISSDPYWGGAQSYLW